MKAIFFDFDGVLARTMEDNFCAWKTVLAEYGYALRGEDYFQYEGEKLQELARRYCRAGNIDEKHIPEIVEKKDAAYLKRHSFSFYPGVVEFIHLLVASDVPRAIVTAGALSRLKGSLPSGFLEQFSCVVSNENGGRGKPYPDPYLAASNMLKLPPEECIVVENAPLGIMAAKTAGSYCVAIASTLSDRFLGGADEIIPEFRALPDCLCARSLFKK